MLIFLFALLVLSLAEKPRFLTTNGAPFNHFLNVKTSCGDATHSLVFAIQQKNLIEMDGLLMERSTPGNQNYQKWLRSDEVAQMSSNPASTKTVKEWLINHNISISWQSRSGAYIKTSASISQWEELLAAKFSVLEETSGHHRRSIHRTSQFSLPAHIAPHLSTVFYTTQKPLQIKHEAFRIPESPIHPEVDIHFLKNFYRIGDCPPNSDSDFNTAQLQQAVVETAFQRFSFADVARFQELNNLPLRPPSDPGGYNSTDCEVETCREGNLNLQYMSGLAPCVQTQFLYVPGDDPFVDWITAFADLADPPRVFSVPWYSIEQARSADMIAAFNTEALKLALQGVTIIVAAGSSGAANDASMCDIPSGSADQGHWQGPTSWTGRGYFPSFPASSPYVTAVGATMIDPMSVGAGSNEIACQSQLGGVITTGGGFSTYNPTPSWQQSAVSAYLNSTCGGSGGSNSNRISAPAPGFNPHGRGYPDVSLLGAAYTTVVNNKVVLQYGSEASTAVFAAMVSLLNAERVSMNMTSVGFMNPTLYLHGSGRGSGSGSGSDSGSGSGRGIRTSDGGIRNAIYDKIGYFADIVSGSNKCNALTRGNSTTTIVCCESGFYASKGWDPVSGLGSIKYPALRAMFKVSGSEVGSAGLSSAALAAIVVGGVFGSVLLSMLFMWLFQYFGAHIQTVEEVDVNSVVVSSHSDAGYEP